MNSDNIKLPNAFWLAIDQLGISRSALIKQANLPLVIALEETKMKTTDFFGLWRALEQIGGPDIGFRLVSTIKSSQMPPSFLVAYHAKDLKDAILRVVRFKHLCTPENLIIHESDELFKITITWPFEDVLAPDALIDATLLSIIGLAQEGTGQNIQPASITLTRTKASKSKFLEDLSVEFNAVENSIAFKQQDMSTLFQRYNQEISFINQKIIYILLIICTEKF